METIDPLSEKIDEARRAMEGPERTEKRKHEEEEKVRLVEQQKTAKRLEEIAKEKEKWELAWISFDDKRRVINDALKPILEQEKTVEEAETKLEIEEARAALPQDKQLVEKKRTEVQDQRQAWERKKWVLQEDLWKLEATMEKNTAAYRLLLDEEDNLKNAA